MAATAGHSGFAGWAGTWRAVAALVLGVTLARVAYLIWACPYTLIEDEAHYWEWGRRLALSYYTKGPGVAWTIGGLSRVLGDHEWVVRLAAALSAGVAAWMVALLGRGLTGDWRAGWFAAAQSAMIPPIERPTTTAGRP